MARISHWALALPLVAVAACASKPEPVAVTPAPAPAPALSQADMTFVQNAAASDAFEVQSAQIAIDHPHSSAAVKSFAQQMAQAHTQSTQQLQQILQTKGVTPPAVQLSADQQDMLAKLKAAHGPKFDHLYVHDQVVAHQTLLPVVQQEASSGQDEAVKAFAQQLTGVVQQHLDEANHLGAPSGMHHHHHHVAKASSAQ